MDSGADSNTKAYDFNRLFHTGPLKVIAVSSGKGGVGKSSFAVNLALSLASKNKRVLLFDGNLAMPCIDLMMDVAIHLNLKHVIQGICSINDTILKGPSGLGFIPGSPDAEFMSGLTSGQQAGLVDSFNELEVGWEYLIVDTAGGFTADVLCFTRSAREMILVLCNEPTVLAGTYAFIKLMNQKHQVKRFHILSNMVKDKEEGLCVYKKLVDIADKYLNVSLNYLGAIPFEQEVREAIKKQKPLISAYPNSLAAGAVKKLASKIDAWPIKLGTDSGTGFCTER
jgi:flagellar biosynthesis protein FlhG